jgi:hypothetical protein
LQAQPLKKYRPKPKTPLRFVRNQRNILEPSVVQYVNPNKPIPVFARHHLLGEWVVGVITHRQGKGVDITYAVKFSNFDGHHDIQQANLRFQRLEVGDEVVRTKRPCRHYQVVETWTGGPVSRDTIQVDLVVERDG